MGQPPYPPGPDPYGQGADPYGQSAGPYGHGPDPYDPYAHSADPYAQSADPYGQQAYYGQTAQPDMHGYQGGAQYSGMPVPYAGSAVPPVNGMATASMVLGLVGVATCGLTSIPAFICGHIAQSQIKRTGESGSGQAVAGLVLGYVLTIGWIVYWVFLFGIMGIALWGAGNQPNY